jgi:hypothetical protein
MTKEDFFAVTHRRILWSIGVLSFCCWLSTTGTASSGNSPGVGLNAIVGAFDCVTETSDKMTWRFHTVNHPWDAWVRGDLAFSPQNGQPALYGSNYIGYDPAAKQWNIIALFKPGSYYTRYSHSVSFDGSQWLDGYPADGARAVIRTYNGAKYTFEFHQPAMKGQPPNSSMTTCTRVHR